MSQRRAGKTVKVSVSLDRASLAALRRRARSVHAGNLSAAFAEAADLIRQREARHALVAMLGGPTLDALASAAIDREQAGGGEPRVGARRAQRPPKRRAA